jgi:hypothetical protein
MMAERSSWSGTASDLLRAADAFADHLPEMGWPSTPRALAGRLRRSQAFLRTIGIDIAFTREGHTGNRTIAIKTTAVQKDAA